MQINESLFEFWDQCHNKQVPLVLWGIGEKCDAYYSILYLAGIIPACIGVREQYKSDTFFKETPVKSLFEILMLYRDINILLTVDDCEEKAEANFLINYLTTSLTSKNQNKINIFCLKNKGTLSAELLTYYRKSLLKRQDFSIISNSCWAFDIYGYLDIEPQTPTTRIIIWPLHYIKFLENFEYYLSTPLTFKGNYITPRQNYDKVHIVAALDDIDIHFVHDTDFDKVYERWTVGIKKLNRENLFIIMEDAHFPLPYMVAERFDKLPFGNRILLTPYDYGNLKSVCRYSHNKIWLRAVLNINHYIRYERFNFVKWFNCGGLGQDFEIKNLCDELPKDYVEWLYSGGMPIHSNIYKLMLYGNN
ncbi:MAG: DUF1919 domain-containing protein [Fibromonadales bacterium]|nr:DUF1919 domain-containing protein [Fibromonadales bacterium]